VHTRRDAHHTVVVSGIENQHSAKPLTMIEEELQEIKIRLNK